MHAKKKKKERKQEVQHTTNNRRTTSHKNRKRKHTGTNDTKKKKEFFFFFHLLLVPILTIGNALVKHETFNALHAEFHVQEGHQCRKRRRGHRAFHEIGLR